MLYPSFRSKSAISFLSASVNLIHSFFCSVVIKLKKWKAACILLFGCVLSMSAILLVVLLVESPTGWLRQIMMFLRDGLKYNFGALEIEWKKQRIYSLVNDPTSLDKAGKKEEMYYEGNCLKRLDPYNTIWDKRVLDPVELPRKGEFVGYTEIYSRVALKQLLLDLPKEFTMNAKEAFESGQPSVTLNGADSWYYMPQINPDAFINSGHSFPTTDWLSWVGDGYAKDQGIRYHNMYEVTKLYGKIIPSDFTLAVPARNQPQIWKFILVNRRILIYVERQTNAHNLLPVLICQPTEDGLGYQTKSFQDNATPFQYMSSALWNAAIEGRRRLVFDRIFYDPSRVRKEDIDKATSVARIPIKQSAYGKPVQDAVYAFPYRDDGLASTLSMAENLNSMADVAVGQNKVQRGQFQKGNKTKVEFQETMGGANSRQQLQALGLEYQVFVPCKEIIKLNILQYQGAAKYYNQGEKKLIEVDPKTLRETAMDFKLSDGLLPTEKLLSTDILQVFMQTLQTSPLMQAEFDIIGAFAYWCKLHGASWFDDFQRSPEERDQILQQLAQQEAAGKPPAARPQNAQGI